MISPIIGSRAWLRCYIIIQTMSKSGETGLGGERQYDDFLDVHVHPFASGGYEIAQEI